MKNLEFTKVTKATLESEFLNDQSINEKDLYAGDLVIRYYIFKQFP